MSRLVRGKPMFLKALQRLEPHNHACLLYDTPEEQFAAAMPFIRIGLERGEKCAYVFDDNSVDAVCEAMSAEGIDVASAQPATALVLVNGQQFSIYKFTMGYTSSMNGSGSWSRVPFLGTGTLYSEPEYVVNARLARILPFTERLKGKLMFEAFNLFNTQFNTGVNTIAYSATAGVLRPVTGLGAANAGTNARSCQVAFRLTF